MAKTKFDHFVVIATLILLSGCAGSPAMTGMRSRENNKNMSLVRADMSDSAFLKVMGPPDKTELFRGKQNEAVMVNMYMTQALSMRESDQIGDKNYTPFVFVDGKLAGWGWTMMNATAQRYEFVYKRQ